MAQNVNSTIYRNNAITTLVLAGIPWQVTAFWDYAGKLNVGVRAGTNDWTVSVYNGQNGFPDAGTVVSDTHNVACVGLDENGYIHVSYNMHNNPLLYRKSIQPISSFDGQLSAVLPMLGINELSVTYPTFFNDPSGKLYFMYRNGNSGAGDLFFYAYNKNTALWGAAVGTSTNGLLVANATESPYWEVPVFDSNFGSGGFMHLSWVWRVTPSASDNHDPTYMRWNGSVWTTVSGAAQTIPATLANTTIAKSIAVNSGLSNQHGLDVDSNGHPHIAYLRTDGGGHCQLFHLWHNGTIWVETQLTNTTCPVFGTGATWLDMARPEVVINRTNNAIYILYRDDTDVKGLLIQKSTAAAFDSWSQVVMNTGDVGYLEPNYDRVYWQANHTLIIQLAKWFNNGAAYQPLSIFAYTP